MVEIMVDYTGRIKGVALLTDHCWLVSMLAPFELTPNFTLTEAGPVQATVHGPPLARVSGLTWTAVVSRSLRHAAQSQSSSVTCRVHLRTHTPSAVSGLPASSGHMLSNRPASLPVPPTQS